MEWEAGCPVTPAQAGKRKERLTVNIQHVIDVGGMSHAFVATFTTQANLSMDEFQSIWNSFMTDVLVRHLGKVGDDWKQHFLGVGIIEPQERGAPHMHLVGTVEEDIETGVRWVKRYWKGKWQWLIARQSRPASLARLQAFLMRSWDGHVRRKTGQTEKKICNAHCMPVRTSARAAARYLAGYLEKGEARPGEWKGRRLYREYGAIRSKNSAGETVVNSPHPCRAKFSRYALETKEGYKVRTHFFMWRARLACFAAIAGCDDLASLCSRLGNDVQFQCSEEIASMVLPFEFPFPNEYLAGAETFSRAAIADSGNEILQSEAISEHNRRIVQTCIEQPNKNRRERVVADKFYDDLHDGRVSNKVRRDLEEFQAAYPWRGDTRFALGEVATKRETRLARRAKKCGNLARRITSIHEASFLLVGGDNRR